MTFATQLVIVPPMNLSVSVQYLPEGVGEV